MKLLKLENNLTTSIVIPTYNRMNDLKATLESIQLQTILPSEILIVVDNGGNFEGNLTIYHEFKEDFKEKGTSLKLLENKGNSGAGPARNVGLRECKGAIVYLLDDDVVLEGDYIEKMLEEFIKDDSGDLGAVMGKFLNTYLRKEILKKDSLKKYYHYFKEFTNKIFFLFSMGDGKVLASGYATNPQWRDKKCYVEWASSGNSAYRGEIIKEFKFDENFKYAYMEDIDFSYRISRKYKILYTPNAKLLHKFSKVRKNNKELMKLQEFGHKYFHKKNIPQSMKYKLAFIWAHYFGLPIYCIVRRDSQGLLGVLSNFYGDFKSSTKLLFKRS